MKTVKKIDIHAHVTAWPEYSPIHPGTGHRFPTAEEIIGFYDELNIEKGVLLPIVAPEAQYDQFSNADCKATTVKYPERFAWFCNVDPRAQNYNPTADLSYLLKHYQSLGARGLGELTAPLPADDPLVDNLFTHCERCDMPVIIHIAPQKGDAYGLIDELGLPRIEKMLKKHPDLKLIGHSQPFWAEISADITVENRNDYPTGKVTEGRLVKLLREYGNLCCDLSAGSGCNALSRDPDFAAAFLTEFADRIFYGCDICTVTNTHQYKLDELLTRLRSDGSISEETYYKVVRGNAAKLLGIE